jgi:hypothetical protein
MVSLQQKHSGNIPAVGKASRRNRSKNEEKEAHLVGFLHWIRTLTRTNTLPLAVGKRGKMRRLSPKTSARACAVWCNAMNARVLWDFFLDYLSCSFVFIFVYFFAGASPLLFTPCVRLLRA